MYLVQDFFKQVIKISLSEERENPHNIISQTNFRCIFKFMSFLTLFTDKE